MAKYNFLVTYRDEHVEVDADTFDNALYEVYDMIEQGEIEPIYEVISNEAGD